MLMIKMILYSILKSIRIFAKIEKKIIEENIWNIDETRFYIDCGRVYWVITLDLNKLLLLTNPDNWEYIILVKSISGRRKNNYANIELV